MRVDVYLPMLVALLLAAGSPALGRRAAPAYAARALVITGVVTAAACGWGLLLLAGSLADQAPPVAARARARGVTVPDPVPEIVAVVAIALLALGAYRVWRLARARLCTRRTLRRLRAAHASDTELIVAESARPQAFALPGRPARILVSSAMLAGLDAAERHVLLTHERAHLRHRHDRLRLLADLSAAANPLLVPLRETVAFLLERWADEDAADRVADRHAAARAVARAALLQRRGPAGCALHFSESAVARRVAALRSAPPPRARAWALLVLAQASLSALAAVEATTDFLRLTAHGSLP